MRLSQLIHLSLLTVVLVQLPYSEPHHVIFEGIGHMASAITYLHVKLTINLTAIETQLHLYETKLAEFHNNVASPPANQHESHYYEPQLFLLRQLHYKQLIKVIEEHTHLAQEVHNKIESIRTMMPKVETVQSRVVDDHPGVHPRVDDMINDESKSKTTSQEHFNNAYKVIDLGTKILPRTSKLLPFLPLALGAVGTFMGLFSQAQISNLAKELKITQENQNRLVEVVQGHEKALKELESAFQTWIEDMKIFKLHDPGLVNSWLNQARTLIYDKLEIITHAIQQAQHRRLAVDFLSSSQLLRLYKRLESEAKEINAVLLTKQPSDLFQLETSYFFDGSDIHLLLHVPAVPHDSMLRLFKLHPFPLPLTSSHSVIPSVKNDILALSSSSGSTRLSAQLSSTDLMGCHVVNSVYSCLRQGVLRKHLNSSCMGSLYLQDYDAVQEQCALEVTPSQEVVHQLLHNWFLIFSPESQTAYVECRNGTQSELHIPAKISKQYLSPGCKANFREHLLYSDSSISVPTDLLHFEWEWNPFQFLEIQENEVLPLVQELSSAGIHRPTISQIQQLKLQETKTHGLWYHTVHFVGNLCIFLLLICLLIFGIYYLITKRIISPPAAALNLLMDTVQAHPGAPREPPANFARQPVAPQQQVVLDPANLSATYYPHLPQTDLSRPDLPQSIATFPE